MAIPLLGNVEGDVEDAWTSSASVRAHGRSAPDRSRRYQPVRFIAVQEGSARRSIFWAPGTARSFSSFELPHALFGRPASCIGVGISAVYPGGVRLAFACGVTAISDGRIWRERSPGVHENSV